MWQRSWWNRHHTVPCNYEKINIPQWNETLLCMGAKGEARPGPVVRWLHWNTILKHARTLSWKKGNNGAQGPPHYQSKCLRGSTGHVSDAQSPTKHMGAREGRAGGRVGGAAETCLPGVTRSRRTTPTSQFLHYHHHLLRLHHLLLSRPY